MPGAVFFNIAPLPIRTDRTLRAVPYVTYAVCFACVGLYLATLFMSPSAAYHFASTWGFIPASPWGATIVTHAFVHVDLLHLLGNMLMLWLVGTVLECGIGPWRFLFVYLASAVAAVALYTLIGILAMPTALSSPMIGASGAIAGVTGFTVFRYYRLRTSTILVLFLPMLLGPIPIPLPYPVWIPLWAYAAIFAARELVAGVQQIADGQSHIAHWAHIGGLALGVLAALLLQVTRDGQREYALEDTVKAKDDPQAGKQTLRNVRQLLLDDPHDPELLEAQAGLTLSKGDTARARDLYHRAMARFLAQGRRDRAAIIYLNLARTFPDDVPPVRDLMHIATTLEGMGRFAEAATAFERIHACYPASPDAENALLRAAQLYHRHLLDPGNAHRLLDAFFTAYPASSWTDLAKKRREELRRDAPQRA